MTWMRRPWMMLAAVLLFQPLLGRADAPAISKQLVVIIVSVENFDDPNYDNAVLEQNIGKATDELESFFRTHFPGALVTVLRRKEQTTGPALTAFFRGTFPSLASGNITLLFILSHGEPLPAPNPIYGSELRIIATDTPSSDIAGRSLSLTDDIVNRINSAIPGSMLFAFVDTCHSGAAANFGLSLSDAVRNSLGIKAMVMGSSLSDQLAFRASFSRALVSLWEHPPTPPAPQTSRLCTVPEVSKDLIRDRIQSILGNDGTLGITEGYPTVLLHYRGAFCLESFEADSGIVALINSTTDSYVAQFVDNSGVQIRESIDANDVVPVRLYRKAYAFSLFRNNIRVSKSSIDLRTDAVDWEVIGVPSAASLGVGIEKAAAAAADIGAPAPSVLKTLQLAYAAYALAKNADGLERVSQQLAARVGHTWFDQRAQASRSADRVLAEVDLNDLAAARREARQMQSFGNVGASGVVLQRAAESAKARNDPDQIGLASGAYLAFTAAGQHESAAKVRGEFKLPLPKICPRCTEFQKSDGDPLYTGVLDSIGAQTVLRNLAVDGPVAIN